MGDFTMFQWLVMLGIVIAIVQLHFIHRAVNRTADTTYRVLEYLGKRDMEPKHVENNVFDPMFERGE